jgi:hypothetical protein
MLMRFIKKGFIKQYSRLVAFSKYEPPSKEYNNRYFKTEQKYSAKLQHIKEQGCKEYSEYIYFNFSGNLNPDARNEIEYYYDAHIC